MQVRPRSRLVGAAARPATPDGHPLQFGYYPSLEKKREIWGFGQLLVKMSTTRAGNYPYNVMLRLTEEQMDRLEAESKLVGRPVSVLCREKVSRVDLVEEQRVGGDELRMTLEPKEGRARITEPDDVLSAGVDGRSVLEPAAKVDPEEDGLEGIKPM